MKQKTWSVTVDDTTHTVSYAFARMKGKITVTIDGDSFDLPAGFWGLKVARREIFRLGDEQAVLAVDRKGEAELISVGRAYKLLFSGERQGETFAKSFPLESRFGSVTPRSDSPLGCHSMPRRRFATFKNF